MKIEENLKKLLINELNPSELEVENVSYMHAGHAGHREAGGGSETHFNVRVVSAKFEGLNRVQRHRLVNDLAGPLFAQGLHALSIKAEVA